jgi:hypothetical protein
LAAGLLTDRLGMPLNIIAVGLLTFVTGVIIASAMQETRK